MKVVCLNIPRPPAGNAMAQAIYTTTWDMVNSKYFLHQLDNLGAATCAPFSLEFYASGSTTFACMASDDAMLDYLCSGVYSWFGDIEIRETNDYTQDTDANTLCVSADMRLKRTDIYPIQLYTALAIDSVAPVVTALSRIHEEDRVLVQLIAKPLVDNASLQASLALTRALDRVKNAFSPRIMLRRDLVRKSAELMKKKCQSHLFKANVRITACSQAPSGATSAERNKILARLKQQVTFVARSMMVLNTTDENSLYMTGFRQGASAIKRMQERSFDAPYRLSAIEMTTLWHPPGLGTLPNTAQVLSKKAPPPRTLPNAANDPQISLFGHTNFKDQFKPFGIRRFDRRRHLYVLGKSGNGKSCLLQLLVKSDIENGFGCAVLDPHGDLVDDILRFVPKHRVKDVVLFDPSDLLHPPSFNPLEPAKPDQKLRVTLSFLDTFRRVFGGDWSESMDHILRYAMTALLHLSGSSVVSLRRFLSDEEFRNDVIRRCPDEATRRFWQVEFSARKQEFEQGPISQLLNKLDELLATDMVRNVLGQPHNLFNFREFMDSRKIVLLKVSKGILGADNASLIGSLLIWKIYEAAMSRADIPVENRQDFYFYVDEFQNFATESFGEILAESRKYRLCLTFANQFLGQLPANIRQTVFGNIANFLCFRVGSEDGGTVAQEFKPRFGADDLINLGLREFYVKMSVDGESQEAFSARTLDLEYPQHSESTVKECIAHSRSKYTLSLSQAQEQLALSEITNLKSAAHG
jgi:hypothetical protein